MQGAKYQYRTTYDGRVNERTLEVRTRVVEGVKGYYFADPTSSVLIATSIGPGFYIPRDGAVDAAQATATQLLDRVKASEARRFLDSQLEEGSKHRFTLGIAVYTVTVGGRENVFVPAGPFNSCRKVEIKVEVVGMSDVYTAWLAEHVGAVKWTISNGRVEELVSYSIPTPAQRADDEESLFGKLFRIDDGADDRLDGKK